MSAALRLPALRSVVLFLPPLSDLAAALATVASARASLIFHVAMNEMQARESENERRYQKTRMTEDKDGRNF